MTMTQEEAHRLFEYKDGVLYWKVRPANCKKIGDIVGSTNGTKQPYFRSKYQEHRFMIHQVVFLMHKGYLPKIIYHIDGNIHNNRIENLREVTQSQNLQNQKMHSNNSTGYRCVFWNKHHKKWSVRVALNGKMVINKFFKDFELACLVADEARDKFHGNYAFKGA